MTTTSRPLTHTQRKILSFVADFTAEHHYAPSMREIGDATGLASTSSVSYQLGILVERGHLVREAGHPRRVAVAGQRGERVSVRREDLLTVLAAPWTSPAMAEALERIREAVSAQ